MNWYSGFFCDSNNYAAFGRAVQLGDNQSADIDHFLKGFNLIERILSGGGIYRQQSGVRSIRDDFFDDLYKFFSVRPLSPVLFCRRPAVINKDDVISLFDGFSQAVKTQGCCVTTVCAFMNSDIVALSPDF